MATRGNIDLKINLIGNASTKFKKMNDNARKFKFMTREIIGDFHKLNAEFQTTNLRLGTAVRKLREFKRESDRTYDTRKIRQYNREVSKSSRASRSTSGLGMRGGLPIAGLGPAGIAAGLAVGTAITAGRFVGNTITAAASRQRSRVELDQLFKGKGNEMVARLDAFANETPLQNRDLYKGAKTLGAFGFKANQVTPMLKMAGDLAMGDAQKLATVTNVLGRTKGLGKLTGELKNMLLETAQIDILGLIAKDTGRSVKDLTEAMSKGQISFDMVTSAMKRGTQEGGKYHNMMEKTSETYEGKLSTFQGKWNLLMADLGDKILPTATRALEIFSSILDSFSDEEDLRKFYKTGMGGKIKAAMLNPDLTDEEKRDRINQIIKIEKQRFDKNTSLGIGDTMGYKKFIEVNQDFAQSEQGKALLAERLQMLGNLKKIEDEYGKDSAEYKAATAEGTIFYRKLKGLDLSDALLKSMGFNFRGKDDKKPTEEKKSIKPAETPNIDENKDIDAATSGGARIKRIEINIGEVKAADRIDVNGMDEVLDTVERDALTAMLNATGFAGNLG